MKRRPFEAIPLLPRTFFRKDLSLSVSSPLFCTVTVISRFIEIHLGGEVERGPATRDTGQRTRSDARAAKSALRAQNMF